MGVTHCGVETSNMEKSSGVTIMDRTINERMTVEVQWLEIKR